MLLEIYTREVAQSIMHEWGKALTFFPSFQFKNHQPSQIWKNCLHESTVLHDCSLSRSNTKGGEKFSELEGIFDRGVTLNYNFSKKIIEATVLPIIWGFYDAILKQVNTRKVCGVTFPLRLCVVRALQRNNEAACISGDHD